jgi:DNA-binding NarL/FixJ family response regulator
MTNLNVVIDNTVHEKLSVKESELIFYFTRGFTSKDIGILMDLSSRTVESYLDSIKSKLHCDSRGELLMHCLSNGLSNIIPQSILQRCLNKIIPL